MTGGFGDPLRFNAQLDVSHTHREGAWCGTWTVGYIKKWVRFYKEFLFAIVRRFTALWWSQNSNTVIGVMCNFLEFTIHHNDVLRTPIECGFSRGILRCGDLFRVFSEGFERCCLHNQRFWYSCLQENSRSQRFWCSLWGVFRVFRNLQESLLALLWGLSVFFLFSKIARKVCSFLLWRLSVFFVFRNLQESLLVLLCGLGVFFIFSEIFRKIRSFTFEDWTCSSPFLKYWERFAHSFLSTECVLRFSEIFRNVCSYSFKDWVCSAYLRSLQKRTEYVLHLFWNLQKVYSFSFEDRVCSSSLPKSSRKFAHFPFKTECVLDLFWKFQKRLRFNSFSFEDRVCSSSFPISSGQFARSPSRSERVLRHFRNLQKSLLVLFWAPSAFFVFSEAFRKVCSFSFEDGVFFVIYEIFRKVCSFSFEDWVCFSHFPKSSGKFAHSTLSTERVLRLFWGIQKSLLVLLWGQSVFFVFSEIFRKVCPFSFEHWACSSSFLKSSGKFADSPLKAECVLRLF